MTDEIAPARTMQESGEHLLLQFAQHGDRAALGEFFRLHADSAYRMAQRLLNNTADAEDAVQGAFCEIMKHAGHYQSGKATPRSWVMSFVVNSCRQKIRTERRRAARERAASAPPAAVSDRTELSSEFREMLSEALYGLPEQNRVSVWLCHGEGFTPGEIASMLDLPGSTVRNQIKRGLDTLRATLSNAGFLITAEGLIAAMASTPQDVIPAGLATGLSHLAAKGELSSAATSGANAAKGSLAPKGGGVMFKLVCGLVMISATGGALSLYHKNAPPIEAPPIETGDPKVAAPKRAALALGDSDYMPSLEHPIGWRGDGTGVYSGATPPKTWSLTLNGPFGTGRIQAAKPTGDKPGSDALDFNPNASYIYSTFGQLDAGRAPKFQILGPFPGTEDAEATLKNETVPNEAALVAEEGKAVKDHQWKNGWITHYKAGEPGIWTAPNQVAYTHSYLYFEEAGTVDLSVEHRGGMKIWFNGKEAYSDAKGFTYALGRNNCHWFTVQVDKGWNRLLCKIIHGDKDGWFRFKGMPTKITGYTSKNIKWSFDMPQYSLSTPLVIGNKVFTTSEPSDLFCFDKITGKLLWVRSTLALYAAEEDEKNNPAEPKVYSADRSKIQQLEKMNEEYPIDPSKIDTRGRYTLEKELVDWVGKNKKYSYILHGWGGGNSVCTPVTDGKVIYVWHGEAGTLACYDLDGGRKWIRYINPAGPGDGSHHGTNASPLLFENTLLIPGWGNFIALDRTTGKELWRVGHTGMAFGTPSREKIDGADVLVSPTGDIFRMSDGSQIASAKTWWGRANADPCSPVVDSKARNFALLYEGEIFTAEIPGNLNPGGVVKLLGRIPSPAFANTSVSISSPMIDNGLVYYSSIYGLLRVAEVSSCKLVYEKTLPLAPTISDMFGSGVAASLVKAGDNVYVFDNVGTSHVFVAGREYKPVATNHMQRLNETGDAQEIFEGSPVFDGTRMYVRGTCRMYCIEESK